MRDTYSDSAARIICSRLATGETLASICRDTGLSRSTIWDWLKRMPDFFEQYEAARKLGYDVIADECLAIADTPIIGEETEELPDGGVKIKRGDMLGHRKLQIETRLKLLAKWAPKKYGEKVALSGDGDAPLRVDQITRIVVDPKSQ